MYDKGTKSNRRRSIEKIKIKKNNSLTPPSRNSARYSRSSSSSPNYRRSHRSRCNSSYSRSRSRESRTYRRSSRCSYSRSRSYSSHRSKSNDRRRSYSRSPKSVPSRKKYHGNRENPQESRCLGIFGLSIYTTEQQITEIFSKYGNVVSVQIVLDAKTGRSRGYGFIYFENCEQAKLAKENCSGMEIDERRIRVDYSITLRAHTPTPGIYMGKPTRYNDGYDSQQNSSSSHRHSSSSHHHHHHHRSSRHARRSRTPSPYYHHRDRKKRVRSRSRSHSARRDRHYR